MIGTANGWELAWIVLSLAGMAFFLWDAVSAGADRRHTRAEYPKDRGAAMVATFIVAYRAFTVYMELFMLAVGILAALAPEPAPSAEPRVVIGGWILRIGALGFVAGLLVFGILARVIRVRLGHPAVLR